MAFFREVGIFGIETNFWPRPIIVKVAGGNSLPGVNHEMPG